MENVMQLTFDSPGYSTFLFVAVSPRKTHPPPLLVLARRFSLQRGVAVSDDLLFLDPVPVAWVFYPWTLKAFTSPTNSLSWGLVNWVDRACVVRESDFAVVSTKHDITIIRLTGSKEPPEGKLEHTIRPSVRLRGCVVQPSMSRVVFAGGSVVGKVDLSFTEEGFESTVTEMRSDWVAKDEEINFIYISGIDKKLEVALGDRKGKVYICLIDSSDTYKLLKEISLPFSLRSVSTCLVSALSLLLVSALGTEGQAVLLHLNTRNLGEYKVHCLPSETPMHFATWLKKDQMVVLATMDNEKKMYFWREVKDQEKGKAWTRWGVRPLGSQGMRMAWYDEERQWLAYSTRFRVVLVEMWELYD